tara:strand:- start:408 stop:1292 length:885 start_codon:yes stop_codon:yes gene_type:complete
MRRIIFLVLLSSLFSQSISDYAYTGFEGTSLCGAVVAQKGGNWSVYHNPAGLSELDNIQVSFGYSKIFNQSFLPYTNIDVIIPSKKKFGNFGISIQQMSIDYNGNTLSSESTLGISQGFFVLKDMNSTMSLGYTINLMNWDLGQSAGISGDGSDGIDLGSDHTFSIDIGLQAALRQKYRVGVFIKNFNQQSVGTGLSSQPLPRRLSIGTAYYPVNGLMTSLVLDRLLGQDIQIKYGMKYEFSKSITMNIGAQSNPNRLGIGLELILSNFNINYSILTHHVLPATQQFSISFILD